MFGQKYHKQLQRLLPFLEQNDQFQTFSNLNENEQQNEQCFTPNYNAIEEDEVNNGDQNNFQPQQDVSCENENSSYQQMRQNMNINYETLFNGDGLFSRNQDAVHNSATSIIVKEPKNTIAKYDFGEFDSSFQNLIDSNYQQHKNQDDKKNSQKDNKNLGNQQTLHNEKQKDHSFNNKDLTKAILSKDPEIRKKYMRQFLSLQKSKILKTNSNSPKQIEVINFLYRFLDRQKKMKLLKTHKKVIHFKNKSKNRRKNNRFIQNYRVTLQNKILIMKNLNLELCHLKKMRLRKISKCLNQ